MKSLSYGSYLRLDELLNLQTPRSQGPEHDELLFIIIHQVYELWFKELLHEIALLEQRLCSNDAARVAHTIRRMRAILKTLVAQLDVMETMTPVDFNAFRGFLESSSGFQSAQFRELEFAFGYKRRHVLHHYPEGSPEHARLEERLTQPTIWDAFLRFLAANSYLIPPEQLHRDVRAPIEPSPQIQSLLAGIYREDPVVQNVCEGLVDIDEGLQEWRYHHLKMVERTIGVKPGTGGSPGAGYLATTIRPFFPDLWAMRNLL